MSLRDMLVVLDGSGRDEAVLNVALTVAGRYDAHLSGLCPLELLYPGDLTGAIDKRMTGLPMSPPKVRAALDAA